MKWNEIPWFTARIIAQSALLFPLTGDEGVRYLDEDDNVVMRALLKDNRWVYEALAVDQHA